jgi:hypothetical protein
MTKLLIWETVEKSETEIELEAIECITAALDKFRRAGRWIHCGPSSHTAVDNDFLPLEIK